MSPIVATAFQKILIFCDVITKNVSSFCVNPTNGPHHELKTAKHPFIEKRNFCDIIFIYVSK